MQNVDQLKKALADSSADPRQFRVLLFSFDDTDRPATLAKYRERENIPLGWSIGTASQPNIDALLEAIGFQVGKAGTEFIHPNMVMFLDSKLRVARWIYGTDYSSRDVDLALKVASGESDWIGQHSQWLYALLLFAGSVLCVALCYYLAQLKAIHRSGSGGRASHGPVLTPAPPPGRGVVKPRPPTVGGDQPPPRNGRAGRGAGGDPPPGVKARTGMWGKPRRWRRPRGLGGRRPALPRFAVPSKRLQIEE